MNYDFFVIELVLWGKLEGCEMRDIRVSKLHNLIFTYLFETMQN